MLLGHLRALLSLSFKDLKGFFQTASRGLQAAARRRPAVPADALLEQRAVPARAGRGDQVLGDSGADNAGEPVGKGPNVLRDELLRHLDRGPTPASFDFAIQLLDAVADDGSTARRRDAAVLGRERQRRVARGAGAVPRRRTADAAAEVAAAATPECEAWFIDVTKFALPDHRPLGSINRARWVAESASRKARLGAGAVAPAPPPSLAAAARRDHHRVGRQGRSPCCSASDGGLAALPRRRADRADQPRRRHAAARDGRSRRLSRIRAGAPASRRRPRQTYYYTAQGAGLKDLRYSWFRTLEMPWSKTKISDPADHAALRFRRRRPSPMNPDGLPVGFAKALRPRS